MAGRDQKSLREKSQGESIATGERSAVSEGNKIIKDIERSERKEMIGFIVLKVIFINHWKSIPNLYWYARSIKLLI